MASGTEGPPAKRNRQVTKSIDRFFFKSTLSSASSSQTAASAETNVIVRPSPSLLPCDLERSCKSSDISVTFKISDNDWIFDASVRLSDSKKFDLLAHHVMPNESFQWPYGLKTKQKVYLSKTHLSGKYEAFKYSLEMKGVVCVPCVLFGQKTVSNYHQKETELGSLVTKPFRSYAKVTELLAAHLSKPYHKASQAKADSFLQTVKNPETKIDNQLDDSRKQLVTENRKRLEPIVKTIIFCGRLGIALRGHRDDGALVMQNAIKGLEGNFRALLAFRVESGDNALKDHLATANKKATYISKGIQNELIELCGSEVLQHVVAEVKAAKYFAVIADETTDSSGQEQLCLCVRYVDQSSGSGSVMVKEQFLGFMSMDDLSAESVANQIVSRLAELDIDINNCVGQGYDGAAAMAGHVSGVQTRIRQKTPTALYVHCASHSLNLVLNHSSQVPPIRGMFASMSEVINFFKDSPKRQAILDTTLVTFCETRFIQRHDAILRFAENFETVVSALDTLSDPSNSVVDTRTKSKAQSLLTAVQSSSFVVALAAAKKVMSLTMTLSRRLQSPSLDLSDAADMMASALNRLKKWRVNNDSWSDGAFSVLSQAEQLASIAGIQLQRKRVSVGRHQHRESLACPNESDTEYFKRTIWLPYLDAVIMQISDKFGEISNTAFMLRSVLASSTIDIGHFQQVFHLYGSLLGCFEEVLYEELNDYVEHRQAVSGIFVSSVSRPIVSYSVCSNNVDILDNESDNGSNSTDDVLHLTSSDSVTDTLALCPKRFVFVRKLLQIAATLPVTSCSAERSFSAMKILKSRLRSTMEDDRLNGLALMYIHSELDISVENVISQFAKMNRKVDFAI